MYAVPLCETTEPESHTEPAEGVELQAVWMARCRRVDAASCRVNCNPPTVMFVPSVTVAPAPPKTAVSLLALSQATWGSPAPRSQFVIAASHVPAPPWLAPSPSPAISVVPPSQYSVPAEPQRTTITAPLLDEKM